MMRPTLSAYNVPEYDMGAIAMRVLTKMLVGQDGQNLEKIIEIKASPIARESTLPSETQIVFQKIQSRLQACFSTVQGRFVKTKQAEQIIKPKNEKPNLPVLKSRRGIVRFLKTAYKRMWGRMKPWKLFLIK